MQLWWHSENNLPKFLVRFGTPEQTCESVHPIDELVEVADDLRVIAAKIRCSHHFGHHILLSHQITSICNPRGMITGKWN